MCDGGEGLMLSSPNRLSIHEQSGEEWRKKKASEQCSDFRDGRKQGFESAQVATAFAGLLSFASPAADFRRSVAVLVRKAGAIGAAAREALNQTSPAAVHRRAPFSMKVACVPSRVHFSAVSALHPL